LTAALQAHARKTKIEIDTLEFTFETYPVLNKEDIKIVPSSGILI